MRRRVLLATIAAGVSGCLRFQASERASGTPEEAEQATGAPEETEQTTDTPESTTLDIRLAFNKTITESDINEETTGYRELAFMCFSVSLWSADGGRVADYDIGGNEDGIIFTGGYYAPETAPDSADGTFRWLGGSGTTTTFRLENVSEASTIQSIVFVGTPVVDDEISATLSIDDVEADSVEFGTRGVPEPYEFSLTRSTT